MGLRSLVYLTIDLCHVQRYNYIYKVKEEIKNDHKSRMGNAKQGNF